MSHETIIMRSADLLLSHVLRVFIEHHNRHRPHPASPRRTPTHETRRRFEMKPLRYVCSGSVVLALVAGIWAVNTQSAGGREKQVPRFVVEPGWPKPGPRSSVT